MIKSKPCKLCSSTYHTGAFCPKKPRKPIKVTILKIKPVKIQDYPFSKPKKPNKSKKPKKLNRTKIKKQLDKLVKDYVKQRDDYTCQWCNKKVSGVSCQGSHVFSVGSCSSLQFEPLNIKVLCAYCHRRRWHSSPPEAMAWFAAKFPDRLKKLEQMKLANIKKSTIELQELVDYYTLKLKS